MYVLIRWGKNTTPCLQGNYSHIDQGHNRTQAEIMGKLSTKKECLDDYALTLGWSTRGLFWLH